MVTPAVKVKTMLIVLTALIAGFIFKARFCAGGIGNNYSGFPSENFSSVTCDRDIDAIRKRGKLIAITDYNSTGYFIYKGEPMGFEFDLLNAFARSIGVQLQVIVATDLNDVFCELNSGSADIIAANLTVTQERSAIASFTSPLMDTRQVLVQRKPDDWKKMSSYQIDKLVVRNTIDLGDKVVHVRKGSSFYQRLMNLSDEIGSEIHIIQAGGDKETEELIAMVSTGTIDYTVADENIALINQTYYPNIDIKTAISFPQHIAWAVRKNSPELLALLDQWLEKETQTGAKNYLYAKYFQNNKAAEERNESDYFSLTGSKISEYDDIIKKYSAKIDWDWRLLASLIYEESHFNSTAVSWAGAYGLMQLIPSASALYGIDSLSATPLESIRAGTMLLAHIENYWKLYVPDPQERTKFTLASYNVGTGHVIDARNLAIKFGKDPYKWENNVEWCLRMKSNSKYYNDPVVKFGYCRGAMPCLYVKEIMTRYDHYRNLIKDEKQQEVLVNK